MDIRTIKQTITALRVAGIALNIVVLFLRLKFKDELALLEKEEKAARAN